MEPQVFSHLVEDCVLLLFQYPVSDIGSGQPCQPSPYHLFLANLLTIWSQPDPLLSTLFDGCDSVVEYSFDPWIWDFVQVLLNFLLWEVFIHLTQKVGHSVVFTFLVLQGKVIASEACYPTLPCSIQIGRGEDVSERVVVGVDYKLIPVLPIRQ